MPNDKLRKLHELLVAKKIDNKSFEEFEINFSNNEEKQRKLHELLVAKKIDNKSFEEFKNIFFIKKKDESQPTFQEDVTESITKDETTPTLSGSSEEKTPSAYKSIDDSVLETLNPELYSEKKSLKEEMDTLPMMSQRYLDIQTRLDEIENISSNKKDYLDILQSSGYVIEEDRAYIDLSSGLDDVSKKSYKKKYSFIDESGNRVLKNESDIPPNVLESINIYEQSKKNRLVSEDENGIIFLKRKDINISDSDKEIVDDVDDEVLNRLNIDKEDYLKWVSANRRKESSTYKFLKTLLTSEEGDEYEKEKKQYEKIKSYKSSLLNDISSDISVLDSSIKLSKNKDEINNLKKEKENLQKYFYKTLTETQELVNSFPKYKEMQIDKDLEERRSIYNAARGTSSEEAVEGLSIVGKTVVGAISGFTTDLIASIPEWVDQRFYGAGYKQKGLFKGLSDMITDSSKHLDLEYGPVKRRTVVQGKPVFYNNEQYFVDENGQVFDGKTNVSVNGILSDNSIKEIIKRSKNVKEEDWNVTSGSILQGGTQTIAQLFALIKAGGKTTKALGLKGPKAGSFGMGVSSYMSSLTGSVEDIRSQLVETGMSEDEALDVAIEAGNAIASLDGIFSSLAGSNEKLLTGLSGIKNQIINLAKTKGKGFSSKQLKDKGIELLKENGKELFIEEMPVLFTEKGINYLVNQQIGSNVLDQKVRKADIIETAILTIGATSTLGSKNLLKGNKRKNFVRSIAKDVDNLESELNKMVLNGDLTKEQAYNVYKEVHDMQVAENKTNGTILMTENIQEASDLLDQRQKLVDQKKGLDGPLNDDIDRKILSIDDQLNNLKERDVQQAKDLMSIETTKEEAVDSLKTKGIDNPTNRQIIEELDLLTNQKKDAIQEQETRDIPDAKPAEGVQEMEEGVRFTTEEKAEKVSDLLNRPVTLTKLGGSTLDTPIEGDMYVEGQQVVVEDADGNITEIGNVDMISNSDLKDIGIEQQVSDVKTDNQGNLQVGEDVLVPDTGGIKRNKRGDISRVVLRSPDGSKTVTLRGVNAEEAAYQILLKEAQSPEQEQKINELLEQDEQFQNELRQAEEATETETDQDTTEVTRAKEEDVEDIRTQKDESEQPVTENEGVSKLRDIFSKKPEQRKQVENAEKALKAVAPDVKIVVHDSEQAYAKATNEQNRAQKTAGEYNHETKTIHINPKKANSRTVAHETFHAILLNMVNTDAEAQRLTEAMMKSVAKVASPELKAYLDAFASNYDQNIRSEEKLAELVGKLASEYDSLPQPTRNVIKRWLDRLAKMFGMKPFTDAEVIDVLNTLAGKIATGQEVTAEDLSIINSKEISDRTVGMSRKQLQDLFLSDEKPNLKSTKDVAKFLDAWTKESAVFEDDVKNISDREIVDRFVDHLTLELHAWEKVRKDDYISFYDDDVVKNTNPTLQKYAKKEYGRELTDTEVKLYHLVSAFASPSANPEMDSWKGFDIFDRWMKTGELSGYSDKIATVWKTLPGGKRVDTGVPRVDEKGMPVRSKVTPAYSQIGLDKFNLLIEKMGGDIDKAMEWITSQHSYSEISDMFGYPEKGPKSMKENEYMTKDRGGLGVFGMTGAKLGSYILNRFGNFSTVTKDMWYARTMARLSGEDLISVNKKTGKEGAIKTPWSESTKQGRRMRSLADQAFKKVGDLFNTSPAMVQERIWDFEKRLYEMLGANEDSAYTSDGLKKGIERAKGSTSLRKQVSGRPSIEDVRKAAKENNISESDTNAYLKELGYTNKEIAGEKINVTQIRQRSEESIKAKQKKKVSIRTKIREKLLDRQARIKGLLNGIDSKKAKNAIAKIVTKAGASGYANFRFKQAEKKIYKGLSNEDIKNLDEIIYASRIVSINENRADRNMEPYTGVEGYDEISAKRDLDDIKSKIGNDKFKELKKRSDIYFTEFNKSLKRMFDSGLISKEVYNQLKDLDYSPIKTIKYIVPESSSIEEIDRVAITSGVTKDAIKTLGDQNANDIIMDSRWLLSTNLTMIESKIFENRMLNAFEDAINSATESEKIALNEYILENPIVGKYKDGRPKRKYDDKYDTLNYTKVYYKKDGIDKYFVMSKKYAEQLLDVKMKQSKTSDVISKLTGTQILRFFATSGNPLFIVGNTAVDFNNILFLSDTYSNFKLLGGTELAYDFVRNSLGKVFQTKTYNKSYEEFMEHGGSIDYLSVDGLRALESLKPTKKITKATRNALKSIGGLLSYLGETSEISFRIAVYEKSKSNQLKKLGRKPTEQEMEDIMFEAAREARETIDFSQGGSATKAADKTLPYLNAATQGLRKGLDYANNNPVGFASNMLQASLMSASLMAGSLYMLLSGLDDEDEIDEVLGRISDYEKANYHIFFTGKKDDDGEYEYYRIKKLPTISVFTTLADQLVIKSVLKNRGIDYDVDGDIMEKSLKSAMPIIPTPKEFLQRNPLLSSVITYTTNYDMFYDKPIFQGPRGKKIDPSAEGIYDPKVNQIYKDFGEATGMSPVRTKAALEKIITSESTNPVIGLIYSGYDSAFKDDTSLSKELKNTSDMFLNNVSKKLKRKTNKNLKVYKERAKMEEDEIRIETDIYKKEQEVYQNIKNLHKEGKELSNSELKSIIEDKFDAVNRKKYYKKFYLMNKKKNVDKEILDIIYEDTPEVQALMLFNRFGDSMESEEKEELNRVINSARRRLSKKALYIYNKKYKKK